MSTPELPGTSWREVGKRGVRQVKAALELRKPPEVPEGREAQWAEPTGAGHVPVLCEHLAWRETATPGVVECQWCWTVATLEQLHAARPEPAPVPEEEDDDVGPF